MSNLRLRDSYSLGLKDVMQVNDYLHTLRNQAASIVVSLVSLYNALSYTLEERRRGDMETVLEEMATLAGMKLSWFGLPPYTQVRISDWAESD